MCGLTTEWILESAQSLACALIRRTFYALERRTTHSSEWEGTQTLRRERQAHRWPSGWGEQCWLDQQVERPITELWGAEKLGRSEGSGIPQNEKALRRSLQWWPEWLKVQEDPQKPPRGLTSRPSVRQFENTEPAWNHHRSSLTAVLRFPPDLGSGGVDGGLQGN